MVQLVEVPDEDIGGQSNGAVGVKSPSRLSFFLDGAHTEESMATCATWFADSVGTPAAATNGAAVETQRVLLFNCMQVHHHRIHSLPFLKGRNVPSYLQL